MLVSGGLDSAVLVAAEAREHQVQPIYVRSGLPWEAAEHACLLRFLSEYRAPHRLLPLASLELPVRDVYPSTQWAFRETPGWTAPVEDLYLPGRNITLLAKAGLFCGLAGIERIAMGQLAGNPFPDATPEFFSTMANALSLGLAHRIEITYPFLMKSKADVIRLGASLGVPFEHTLSCLNPIDSRHCGVCNKCRERREGFIDSGVEDRTIYEKQPVTSTHARDFRQS